MVARVVPNSVSMVAQTAPPTSVTVRKGRNRRFFLTRFGQGTPSGSTAPTLGGQAHDETDARGSAGNRIDTWLWKEAKIQSAGVSINGAGSAAIAAFAETGITEYIWCWGTIENSDQSDAVSAVGAATTSSSSFVNPSAGIISVHGIASDIAQDYILLPTMYLPATIRLSGYDDMLLVKGPVEQTSYVAYLHETMMADLEQWTFTTEAAFTEASGQTLVIAPSDIAQSAPELPIHAVRTRSIDAKTLADRYNMGQPKQEDYLFQTRKFYQRDDN